MKAFARFLFRALHGALLSLGLLALLAAAAQFTNLPWRTYLTLAAAGDSAPTEPTHVLVMGGSGIPGESGFTRTYFGAEAARRHPRAQVLLAMPLDVDASYASRAYVDEFRLRGVAPERVRVVAGGRNTREQALRIAAALADQAAPVLLVVSDPYHIRRTAACLRRAFAERGRAVRLDGLPVFPLSIEDPLVFRAADLDAPNAAPVRSAVPDVGSALRLRYDFWNNLNYSVAVFREGAALFYYRLRRWI